MESLSKHLCGLIEKKIERLEIKLKECKKIYYIQKIRQTTSGWKIFLNSNQCYKCEFTLCVTGQFPGITCTCISYMLLKSLCPHIRYLLTCISSNPQGIRQMIFFRQVSYKICSNELIKELENKFQTHSTFRRSCRTLLTDKQCKLFYRQLTSDQQVQQACKHCQFKVHSKCLQSYKVKRTSCPMIAIHFYRPLNNTIKMCREAQL